MGQKRKRFYKLRKKLRRKFRPIGNKLYWWYIDFRCWWGSCWPVVKWLHLKYGIRNLVRWLPIIWRDRDWDAIGYLLPLMEKKLAQMERCERNFSLHVSAERHARQIQICKNLTRRLREGDYIPWHAYSDELENWLGTGILVHRLKNPIAAYKRETEMRKQDMDLLFKIMCKHIEEWWS